MCIIVSKKISLVDIDLFRRRRLHAILTYAYRHYCYPYYPVRFLLKWQYFIVQFPQILVLHLICGVLKFFRLSDIMSGSM